MRVASMSVRISVPIRPKNATVMPRKTLSGPVVDLGADPQPADRLRTPDAEHDEALEREHGGGERRVGAAAPPCRAPAASGSGPAQCPAGGR